MEITAARRVQREHLLAGTCFKFNYWVTYQTDAMSWNERDMAYLIKQESENTIGTYIEGFVCLKRRTRLSALRRKHGSSKTEIYIYNPSPEEKSYDIVPLTFRKEGGFRNIYGSRSDVTSTTPRGRYKRRDMETQTDDVFPELRSELQLEKLSIKRALCPRQVQIIAGTLKKAATIN